MGDEVIADFRLMIADLQIGNWRWAIGIFIKRTSKKQ